MMISKAVEYNLESVATLQSLKERRYVFSEHIFYNMKNHHIHLMFRILTPRRKRLTVKIKATL